MFNGNKSQTWKVYTHKPVYANFSSWPEMVTRILKNDVFITRIAVVPTLVTDKILLVSLPTCMRALLVIGISIGVIWSASEVVVGSGGCCLGSG